MQLTELRLNNFGKFNNKTIELKDGINLIYGENEAGKSTIHSFVKGMLFGIEKLRGRASKDDAYLKYQPWDSPGAYNGSMDINVKGKTYRILRNFEKNTKNCSVIDLETGRELNLRPEEMNELYGGLTESGYRNTISIEQLKSRTDYELVEEIRNYITNLSLTKSNEVDVTKALSYLQEKRKEMDTHQISLKLEELEDEIAQGLALETKIDGLTLQLREIEERLKVLQKKKEVADNSLEGLEGFASIEAYNAYLDQFPAIREKYRSYLERINQRKELNEKQTLVHNQLRELEETKGEALLLQQQIIRIEEFKSKRFLLEEKRKNLIAEKDKNLQSEKHKMLLGCLVAVILGLLGILFFIGKSSMIAGVFTILVLASVIIYFYLTHRTSLTQKSLDQTIDDYEKDITELQAKERELLLQYKAFDEVDLKNKQEAALRREMSFDHFHKQGKDYREQAMLLEEKLATLQQEIVDYRNQLPDSFDKEESSDIVLNGSAMNLLEEHIIRQKQRIARYHESTAKEYESTRIQKEKLLWELNSLEGNEVKLLQNKDLHKELVKLGGEKEQELAAIKLATQTINNLSVDIHDSFGGKLNQLVSGLAGEVTNGKYADVKVDEKLSIKVGHKDNFVLLEKLSAGTIEQMYFSLRIAISNLVYGEDVMPILLDDCFALYDDNRTKATLEALHKNRNGQVLLFTCHHREQTLLDQLNINYNYIDLSSDNR